MINVQKNSKIYIFAPANTSTGGPECLHQLGKGLKDLGLNVFMYYVPMENPHPVHSEYNHYNIPYSNKIDDDPENIIIVPELYNYIILLKQFKKAQKIIWWLSIDNFYGSYYFSKRKIIGTLIWGVNLLSKKFLKKTIIDFPRVALAMKIDFGFINAFGINLHLAQSDYAKNHLESKGLKNIEYLFDYTENGELLDFNNDTKEDLVLYNPAKGVKFTKDIISIARNIKFIPIEKMNHVGVIDLMKKSKVYIDFGNHPGRDKMPREAALCGCCIITDKRGSAFFYKDISIPDKYKFEDKKDLIPEIIKTIEMCLKNFDIESKSFDPYRDVLKNDKKEFHEKLKLIFQIKVQDGLN